MPVLHTYRSKEGFYILAGICGKIATYRLSSDGARSLKDNSIDDGDKFSWTMLLELIRKGDAYTSNSGGDTEDLSGWTQLGLLFNIPEHEPTQAEPVPLCASGSMEGLHIAELTDLKAATLLCDECRKAQRNNIDASVPIYMINTPPALDHLLERSGLIANGSVTAFRELLSANHAEVWNRRIRVKGQTVQTGLFEEPENQQQCLL